MLLGPSLRSREDPVGLCQPLKWPDEKPNSLKVNRLLKLKRRRDSNVQRGEDAVKIRLESEEKAKKSGETSKTYKN